MNAEQLLAFYRSKDFESIPLVLYAKVKDSLATRISNNKAQETGE